MRGEHERKRELEEEHEMGNEISAVELTGIIWLMPCLLYNTALSLDR